MKRFAGFALLLAPAGLLALAGLPASAQGRSSAEIVLIEGAAPVGVTVLGEVRAEIHQTSLLAKTPARDLADRELREQAAKLGADAVVGIRYENNPALFSKKGFLAAGKAVKFDPAPVQVAAAPAAPSAPAVEPGQIASFALAREAAAAPASLSAPPGAAIAAPQQPVVPPPAVASAPAPAALPLETSPVVLPSPQVAAVAPPPAAVAPPATQPAAVAPAAVAAAPRGPTPEALIVLTEDDLLGRAYDRLGEVNAAARQTSLFPVKSARAMMDEQLRARAVALGADAVIRIRYQSSSPLLSRRGSSATGIAVKFR